MKIVIDIDDDVYNFIKNRGHIPYGVNIANEIADGAVLPKGHGDLIDRNELLSGIEKEYTNKLNTSEAKAFVEFMAYIDEEPKPMIEADKEAENEDSN